ncbi:MAG: hypothetical protein IJR08_05680 [Bacilli bacterium]|nr:hypothetical protein [Bacilli bacterium]
MSKKRFFIPLAAFSLLLTSMVACNANNNNNPSNSGGGNPSTSAQKSDSSGGDAASSSSAAPAVHVHDYNATASKTVKNADDKNVSLYECKENDGGKLMTIAFDDYSEKSADFGDTSGYGNVPEELRNSSRLLAKNSTISWKVNVDKAITGAQLAFGMNYTGSDHDTQEFASKCKIKVNNGSFVDWDLVSGKTYGGAGLAQKTRNYVAVATINLDAGENTISLQQGNGGYRLLYGGDVRIAYEGEANPVAAPASGYDITFVPAEHCKVMVYVGENEKLETNKTQSVNADDKDPETQRFIHAKYRAGVEDDPATADVNEEVTEIKPEVIFQLVFDDGYTADGNDITISGTMGNEWNKLCSYDDDNSYNITKIKAAITVTIAVRAVTGSEKAGYLGTFNIQHGTIVVYQGAKNAAGDNIDTPDADSKYLSRVSKSGKVSKTKAQFNFEVFPEEGYEFVSGLALKGESSPIGVTQFVTGNFGNFKRDANNGNLYSITKIASDIVVNIVCTPIAAA